MAAALGTYNYTYGVGNHANRQIQFVRPGAGAGTIQAQVFVLNPGPAVGALIATVPGNDINVEMASTTAKVAARTTGAVLMPDRALSTLTIAEQNALMGDLPNRKITVANDHLGAGGFETVESLEIFDPR
jgi:hypothetical protein